MATTLAFSPTSVSLAEGDDETTPFVFTLSRSGDLSGVTSADWSVLAGGPGGHLDGPASAGDFVGGVLPSGSASFAPGQTTATITIDVVGDTTPELNEVFRVQLSNLVGATTDSATGVGYIGNDDIAAASPTLSISPATITQAEGDLGPSYFVYTVTRSGDASGPTTVQYAVAGSGTNPADASDFVGGALPVGTVYFGGGETTKQVYVPVAGDRTVETNETFSLTLSNVSGATIENASATGTIVNDDASVTPQPAPPTISISPLSITQAEGDGATSYFVYTVTRSGDASGPTTAHYAAAGSGPNPANAGDFVGGTLPEGTVYFGGGETTKEIYVPVAGDRTVEANEAFSITLSNVSGASIIGASASGSIINDDARVDPVVIAFDAQNIQLAGVRADDAIFA